MTERRWYLKEKCLTAWRVVLQCAEKAAVFIESKAAECLHWNGGLEQLYNVEPAVISDLKSSQHSPNPNIRNAVVICSAITPLVMLDLSDIILRNSFTSFTLITSLVDSNTQQLENEIKGWLSASSLKLEVPKVEIMHFSYFLSPVLDNMFFFPSFNQLPIILSDKVPYDRTLLKTQMQHIATSLHDILMEYSCSDIIYSMGTVSNEIAEFLQAHPSTNERRKAASSSISVVLVDRGLDLGAPSTFDTDCLLDRILGTLPHLPDHSSDVAIDMSPLCHAKVEDFLDEALAPGCLAHSDRIGTSLLESLVHKKQRAVISELNMLLVGEEGDAVKAIARAIKPQTLENKVTELKGNYPVIMEKSSILQICLAVIQSLIGSRANVVDVALKYEKLLLGGLLTEPDHDNVLDQLSTLISKRAQYGLSVDILLAMIISMYSLAGSMARFSDEKENEMMEDLAEALYSDQTSPGIAHNILFPMQADIHTIEATVRRFMGVLKIIVEARKSFPKYSSVLRNELISRPASQPLLVLLLKDILSRDIGPPYLTIPSDGRLMSLFFGSSKSSSKAPQPADTADIFLFVVGGVTGREVRELQETWSRADRPGRLLIGSTSLLSPTDVLTSILRHVTDEDFEQL